MLVSPRLLFQLYLVPVPSTITLEEYVASHPSEQIQYSFGSCDVVNVLSLQGLTEHHGHHDQVVWFYTISAPNSSPDSFSARLSQLSIQDNPSAMASQQDEQSSSTTGSSLMAQSQSAIEYWIMYSTCATNGHGLSLLPSTTSMIAFEFGFWTTNKRPVSMVLWIWTTACLPVHASSYSTLDLHHAALHSQILVFKEALLRRFGKLPSDENKMLYKALIDMKQQSQQSISIHAANWEHQLSLLAETLDVNQQSISTSNISTRIYYAAFRPKLVGCGSGAGESISRQQQHQSSRHFQQQQTSLSQDAARHHPRLGFPQQTSRYHRFDQAMYHVTLQGSTTLTATDIRSKARLDNPGKHQASLSHQSHALLTRPIFNPPRHMHPTLQLTLDRDLADLCRLGICKKVDFFEWACPWYPNLMEPIDWLEITSQSTNMDKTALSAQSGQKFTVMPFGLVNAPALLQLLTIKTLGALNWSCCIAYMDDIIVYSCSASESGTDHQVSSSLQWSANAKDNTQDRIWRWSMYLQQFHYQVFYVPGSTNQAANALSRHPLPMVSLIDTTDKIDWLSLQAQDPDIMKIQVGTLTQLSAHHAINLHLSSLTIFSSMCKLAPATNLLLIFAWWYLSRCKTPLSRTITLLSGLDVVS
ncbi:hypothetical protein [Absidia glauca]|uniref:Reverse transcriptase domain-containing protein n=1 Tax=Absidia glauca TaxID=4829 RepID=A0A168LB54_ABSGL|nr:hypothetical protein [Absidia glauca]